MNTVELINVVAKRPGMYVDVTSIDSIYYFIQGFFFSRSISGNLDHQDQWFAEGFYPWLKAKHSLDDVATWRDQIVQIASIGRTSPWVTFMNEFKCFQAELGQSAAT